MFSRTVRNLLFLLILFAVVIFFLRLHPRSAARDQSRRNDSPRERRAPRHRERRPGTLPDDSANSQEPGQVLCETQYLADWQEPSEDSCNVQTRRGYPVPDARCTPGGVNPSVTIAVLEDASWRTRAVRNCGSSEAQKHIAYRWYEIEKPRINSNANQVCELDHLVPLELGGADGLGNIWPQCGPDSVSLNERYFKKKDHVENYLAEEVRAGRMPLEAAQKGIAADWTQYLDQAESWCTARSRC